MNDTATSASGASLLPDSTTLFTTAHLAIIAILIVLTIIAIGYGMKLARQRHAARDAIDEHNATVEASPPPPPAPTSPAPVAPSPTSGRTDVPSSEPAAPTPPAERPADTAPAAPGGGEAPVTQLKGLGPKVAGRLGELGITTVAQLAALDDAAAARLDDELGTFKGRMARDRWIEQARLLAAGDRAGFEAAFGKLDKAT